MTIRANQPYFYHGFAPVPLSTFAGEPSQNVGKSCVKSYVAILFEGAVILLACIIFCRVASSHKYGSYCRYASLDIYR